MTTSSLHYGNIIISCECEKCGKPFQSTKILGAVVSDQKANYISQSILQDQMMQAIKNLEWERQAVFDAFKDNRIHSRVDLPIKKCPGCGHYQSWMLSSVGNRNIHRISLRITFVFFFILLFLFMALLGTFESPPDSTWLASGIGCAIWSGMLNIITYYAVRAVLRKKYTGPKKIKSIPAKEPLLLEWIPIRKMNNSTLDSSWTRGLPDTFKLRK
jgi:hypothetical protein